MSVGIRGIHAGLEGFRGDLCPCLDHNEKRCLWVSEASTWVLGEIRAFVWTLGLCPEQFSCPSPRRAGLLPGSGLRGVPREPGTTSTDARTQFGTCIWRGLLPQPPAPAREDGFGQVLIAFLLRLFQALSGKESRDTPAHPSVCPPAARGGNGCGGGEDCLGLLKAYLSSCLAHCL